jgi:hypothetical protein
VAWKSKIGGPLRYAGIAIGSAGLAGWCWAMEIWYRYMDTLPSSPDPASGNIYPLNVHGTIVYQTLKQQVYRERWEFYSMAVLVLGAALGEFGRWILGKQRSKCP